MSEITLTIGNRNYSSWSLRAWLPLKVAGAAFTENVVLLGQEDTATEISRHSPTGLVPVLRHGELIVWDSLAIAEYVAELYPSSGLWPKDPQTRALARSVTAEMHSGFTAVRGNMPMNIRASYPGEGRAAGVDGDIERIVSIWSSCRREFGSGGDFLFGSFTVADAFFAPIVSRFRTYGVQLDGVARDYADALWHWPAMQQWTSAAEAEEWSVDRYDR